MKHRYPLAAFTGGLCAALAVLVLQGCGEVAKLAVVDGTGRRPALPAPAPGLIPTVNIAPAIGWPAGVLPTAAAGTQVTPFASGLDHPRWLLVLPNGDVLVAETNAPPKPDDAKGIKGWAMKVVMKRAGAGAPSANRISLLRDTRGTGVADQRSVFLQALNSPFGMALVGNQLYVATSDAVLRFPYATGDTQITAPGVKLVDLPAGTINHHWTKNLIASADGKKLYVTVGSNSNVGERGMAAEAERAAIWEVDAQSGAHRVFASGLRNPNEAAPCWWQTMLAMWCGGSALSRHHGRAWVLHGELDVAHFLSKYIALVLALRLALHLALRLWMRMRGGVSLQQLATLGA